MDELCLLMEKLSLSDVKNTTKVNTSCVKKKWKIRKRVRCWNCKKLGHKQRNCYKEKYYYIKAGDFKKSNNGPIRVRGKYRKSHSQWV